MDVFRVFDSLNYVPNMIVGMDAVGNAGKWQTIVSFNTPFTPSSKYRADVKQLAHVFWIHLLGVCSMSALLDRVNAV